MAIFTANKPNKVVTIHKKDCRVIPWAKLKPCGCGDTGTQDNQRWACEEHITLDEMEEYMNGRFWAVLLCDICFREEKK